MTPQATPISPDMGMDTGLALPTPNRKMEASMPSRSTVKKTTKKSEYCEKNWEQE